MSLRLRSLVVALILAATPACSLLGLDHLHLETCTDSDPCEVANQAANIAADACTRYSCDPDRHVCTLRIHDWDGDRDEPPSCGGTDCDDHDATRAGALTETCDGIDNDCDGTVDDGAWVSGAPRVVTTGLDGTGPFGHATRSDGTLGVARGGPSTTDPGLFASVDVGTTAAATRLTWEQNADETNLRTATLTRGCPPGMTACDFAEPTLAPVDANRWFFGAVNTIGCAAGQLRFGYLDETDASVVLRGPVVRSTIATGVDVDAMGCTGASRTGAPDGVTQPALASAPVAGTELPQALAAWIGRPATTPACSASVAPVEGLGLWLETESVSAMPIYWVNGTGSGVPDAIGTTTGDDAPGVVAVGESGYLVGFGNATGDVELRWIAHLGMPPPIDETRVADDDPTYPSYVRPTDPLVVSGPLVVAHGSAAPDAVALSVGATRADGTDVGVAWREGCAASGGAIWFSRVRIASAPARVVSTTTPVKLVDSGGNHPVLGRIASDLVISTYVRGAATADATTTGGWVVAWDDAADGMSARRVLELDGASADEAAISLSMEAPVTGSALFERPGAHPLGYAFETADATLSAGAALCAPAP